MYDIDHFILLGASTKIDKTWLIPFAPFSNQNTEPAGCSKSCKSLYKLLQIKYDQNFQYEKNLPSWLLAQLDSFYSKLQGERKMIRIINGGSNNEAKVGSKALQGK